MTRKELKTIPRRKWNEELEGVKGVWVFPSGRKHDSGWACMDFIATFKDRDPVRFGGGCDVVLFDGNHFRMDCEYPSRVIRIFNICNTFSVSADLSTIYFKETT